MLSLEYIAGFFDADGCVSATGTRPAYFLTAALANRNLTVLEEIQSQWGGSIHTRPNGSSTLTISTAKARKFLTAILPFLVIKQAVATKGLTLHSVPPSERATVFEEMSRLNRITSPNAHYERRKVA